MTSPTSTTVKLSRGSTRSHLICSIRDTPVAHEISRVLEALYSEPGTKTRQSLYYTEGNLRDNENTLYDEKKVNTALIKALNLKSKSHDYSVL